MVVKLYVFILKLFKTDLSWNHYWFNSQLDNDPDDLLPYVRERLRKNYIALNSGIGNYIDIGLE